MDQQVLFEFPDYHNSKYKMVSKLGNGASGNVFKVEKVQKGQESGSKIKEYFAVKCIPNVQNYEIQTTGNFIKLASQGKIQHNAKIYAINYDNEAKEFRILMEYCDGVELQNYYQANNLTISQIEEITYSLCLAIKELHDLSILHRDLKPQNIIICKDKNGSLIAKLIDIGIAKKIEPGLDQTQLIGTDFYMAPELFVSGLENKINFKTDIFAFGLIIYELFAKKPLFQGFDIFSEEKILKEFDARCKQVEKKINSQKFKNLVEKMIKYDSEQRISLDKILEQLQMKEQTETTEQQNVNQNEQKEQKTQNQKKNKIQKISNQNDQEKSKQIKSELSYLQNFKTKIKQLIIPKIIIQFQKEEINEKLSEIQKREEELLKQQINNNNSQQDNKNENQNANQQINLEKDDQEFLNYHFEILELNKEFKNILDELKKIGQLQQFKKQIQELHPNIKLNTQIPDFIKKKLEEIENQVNIIGDQNMQIKKPKSVFIINNYLKDVETSNLNLLKDHDIINKLDNELTNQLLEINQSLIDITEIQKNELNMMKIVLEYLSKCLQQIENIKHTNKQQIFKLPKFKDSLEKIDYQINEYKKQVVAQIELIRSEMIRIIKKKHLFSTTQT